MFGLQQSVLENLFEFHVIFPETQIFGTVKKTVVQTVSLPILHYCDKQWHFVYIIENILYLHSEFKSFHRIV